MLEMVGADTVVQRRAHGRRCLILALSCAAWGPGDAQPTPDPTPDEHATSPADPFLLPIPRDPDDAPFADPPNNQLRQWSAGRARPLTRSFSDRHRVQLTVAPTYAAFRVAFLGRGSGPLRGGGAELDLDLRLLPWLFLRAFASHTTHPVSSEASFDEEEQSTVPLADGGLIQATDTGLSLVYNLDLGRFVPRVDVGAGLLFVRSPSGPLDGQWGGSCQADGVCDLGLDCRADDRCRPRPVFEAHAGIAVDLLIGQRWAVGAGVRYYALISALADLPVYIAANVRLSARF